MPLEAQSLGEALARVLLTLVERETDPRERAARLAILRRDGHLPGREAA